MLFVIAAVLFVAGLAMILIGDAIRRGAHKPDEFAVPEKFWDWFLSVVKEMFGKLTGDAGPGEKIAAAGAILLAASVIAFVAGIGVALQGDDSTSTSSTMSASGSR